MALVWIIAIIMLAAIFQALSAQTLEGSVKVIDGDSLEQAGTEIRLVGIDAPEFTQTCTRNGENWACGREARRFLRNLVRGAKVSCSGSQHDQYDRLLATCSVGGKVINREMVENGWAVSYGDYQSEEDSAKTGKRGLWSGEFVNPREFRRSNLQSRGVVRSWLGF